MASTAEPQEPSSTYINYDTILDPSFSSPVFANSLVLTTNNPTDTPLDLSTPLSRVLFDVQEVDQNIHSLTSKSAIPLLSHAKSQDEASQRIINEIEAQLDIVAQSYKRLEQEVVTRYETTAEVQLVASRLWETARIGRVVSRCLLLSRQLEIQMQELGAMGTKKEDHRALVRASHTILGLRQLFTSRDDQGRESGLEKINIVRTLRNEVIVPSEEKVRLRSQQIVREFSVSPLASSQSTPSTFAQTEDARARTTSAIMALYLLSPYPNRTEGKEQPIFTPTLLLSSLQAYLQTSLTSSLASLSRALSNLPTLDRTLLEISSRCQNIAALESLLSTLSSPHHPFLSQKQSTSSNLLAPLLLHLDTPSLPSFFWRSLASALPPKVNDIMNRGGASSRTLRANREGVRDAIRACVFRGSERVGGQNGRIGNWEREAAVMVGAVIGNLGRSVFNNNDDIIAKAPERKASIMSFLLVYLKNFKGLLRSLVHLQEK
ncbi:MAG: hypothetical protein M1834_008719 [Cirrosporium novae-zelandiae]|nr:MAG: hypothetical protein M1834_008719 [Cirrosporium novae-zelandiae]